MSWVPRRRLPADGPPSAGVALAGDAQVWAVRAESALSAAVLDTVEEAIVACDADGRLTLFNLTARRFHGVPPDGSIDPHGWASAFDLYAEDGTTPLGRDQVPLWRALQGEHVRGAVITIAPVGTRPRFVRCDGRPLHDRDGALLGAVVAMTDLSDEREAAAALADERDVTRGFLATTTDAYVRIDSGGFVTGWNPSAERMFGWTEQEALGRDVVTLMYDAADRPAARDNLAELLGEDLSAGRRREARFCARDGRPVDCDVTGWSTKGPDGWAYHGLFRDLVASRRAALVAEELNRSLRAALDLMPRAITLTTAVRDAAGEPVGLVVEWLNAYACAQVDRTVEEVAGRQLGELFPTVAARFLPTYLDVVRSGVPQELDVPAFTGAHIDGAFVVTLNPIGPDTLLIDVADAGPTPGRR